MSAVTFPAYEDTDAGLRMVARALRSRGDDDAIRRRLDLKPELADLLPTSARADGQPRVESKIEEPGETTPRSAQDDSATDAPEPAETTRNAPSAHAVAAARLRFLQGQLRRPAA